MPHGYGWRGRRSNKTGHVIDAWNCRFRKRTAPVVDYAICPECPLPKARRQR